MKTNDFIYSLPYVLLIPFCFYLQPTHKIKTQKLKVIKKTIIIIHQMFYNNKQKMQSFLYFYHKFVMIKQKIHFLRKTLYSNTYKTILVWCAQICYVFVSLSSDLKLKEWKISKEIRPPHTRISNH